ncbi:hypothetical protein ESZ36_08620 [Colwellia demingiae]|uniref:Uncharacterized protein n=1 Tax=Colwellia demingiae TaxID=89401 RepID=A0A5C6QIV6_9GAMM|nr:hypothetical protein [Colwellia demingiae]TWX68548.1 hypothetical protein ESZ36_08620 [Colwellia demingiae]
MSLVYSQKCVMKFKSDSREEINVSITDSSFVEQSAIDTIMKRVDTLDFVPHGYKLQKEHNWSESKINYTINLYKEWLVLQVLYEDLSFAPSELVDEFWHIHILDTRKYMNDCNSIKGEFIHHYPYFGLTDQENETVLESGFQLTKKLYLYHFGHCELGFKGEMSASCGCRSGNGGSCR